MLLTRRIEYDELIHENHNGKYVCELIKAQSFFCQEKNKIKHEIIIDIYYEENNDDETLPEGRYITEIDKFILIQIITKNLIGKQITWDLYDDIEESVVNVGGDEPWN